MFLTFQVVLDVPQVKAHLTESSCGFYSPFRNNEDYCIIRLLSFGCVIKLNPLPSQMDVNDSTTLFLKGIKIFTQDTLTKYII